MNIIKNIIFFYYIRMSSYNPDRQPLNSWTSMFNLGNQPKIPGQCKQNLRFIDQDSANPRNRYRLRRAFGNQIFNTTNLVDASYIIFLTESNYTVRAYSNTHDQTSLHNRGILVNQNNKISQFNRSSTEFVFTVPKISDLSYNVESPVLGREFIEHLDISRVKQLHFVSNDKNIIVNGSLIKVDNLIQDASDVTLSISDNTGEFRSGLTPFRKAFNAGDMFTRNNSATSTLLPKPPNQVNSLRNMFGWQNNAGSVQRDSNGSFYSGNPRFVYDGSDYSRFKKLQAINRNYNDITFGGDQHSASQQAYRRVVNR